MFDVDIVYRDCCATGKSQSLMHSFNSPYLPRPERLLDAMVTRFAISADASNPIHSFDSSAGAYLASS